MNNQASPITVGEQLFQVDGDPVSLYGGAAHYWRLDRDKWDDILDKVKAMGFTMISIYIPWEIHEIERGRFDFGEIDPRKDIDAYLSLIESKGMRIIVRPGPQINSELTWFGYPLRILADPDLQARNGQGTTAVLTQAPRPIPAVSYAVEKFYDETAIWYDAICPILAKHAYPNGGLVAAQVDNEMAFFFHVNAYASDYSDASIARYRTFLRARHGSVDQLNERYGTNHATFDQVEPPRRFEAQSKYDIPYLTDWITYRERYLIDSMDRLAGMMRDRGLAGVPLFHNYPHPLGPGGAVSGFTTPFNITELEEKLAFVGFDIYSRKELYEHVKTIVSYVVGTSRFPYIPEFIAGVWPWYLNPGALEDEEFVTKAALMHGIKGFSRYMLVERDRWLDSPIRRDGRVREDHAAMFGGVNQLLTDHDFVDLRRQADVVLLANRDYDRLEAACVLVSFPGDFLETPSGFSEYPSFMTVSERSLGFEAPIQVAKTDRFWAAYRGLTDAGIAFLLSDTALPADRWASFRAVVVSSYEYMARATQTRIVDFARGGGTVILGPRVPSLDEDMRPDDTLGAALDASAAADVTVAGAAIGLRYPVGSGAIVVVEDFSDPAAAFEAILGEGGLTRFSRNDPRLDLAVHRTSGDSSSAIVFVANPTAEPIDAEIGIDGGITSGRELWEDREADVSDGRLRDHLPPYTIKIYACAQ